MSTGSATGARTRSRRNLILLVAGALIAAGIVVGIAVALRTVPAVADFIETYPGGAPSAVPVQEGFPAWVSWQHFLNFFLLAMLVRTGLVSRGETRPMGYWSPRNRRSGLRLRLPVFAHLTLDVLWIANGLLYIVLLFATGRWSRLVPTDWEVIPHAVSVGLQYASLQWPTESSWVHYNALQQMTYFLVVFVLAPASFVTGLRLSPMWPKSAANLLPLERARKVHFPLMIAFVLFVVGHVALVLLTGAVRNLNHMFAGTDGEGWTGVIMFGVALVVTAGAVLAIRPMVLRTWAGLFGSVTR